MLVMCESKLIAGSLFFGKFEVRGSRDRMHARIYYSTRDHHSSIAVPNNQTGQQHIAILDHRKGTSGTDRSQVKATKMIAADLNVLRQS
jgi:hypothetical protein